MSDMSTAILLHSEVSNHDKEVDRFHPKEGATTRLLSDSDILHGQPNPSTLDALAHNRYPQANKLILTIVSH